MARGRRSSDRPLAPRRGDRVVVLREGLASDRLGPRRSARTHVVFCHGGCELPCTRIPTGSCCMRRTYCWAAGVERQVRMGCSDCTPRCSNDDSWGDLVWWAPARRPRRCWRCAEGSRPASSHWATTSGRGSGPSVGRVDGIGHVAPSSCRWTFQAVGPVAEVRPFPSGLEAGSMAVAGSRKVVPGSRPEPRTSEDGSPALAVRLQLGDEQPVPSGERPRDAARSRPGR